jgi:hypothetical protein
MSDVPLPDPSDHDKFMIPYAVVAYVKRIGFDAPTQAVARWGAYAQTTADGDKVKLNKTWALRGPEQLEKCSKAAALREAFPEELAGLYTEEEVGEETKPQEAQAVVSQAPSAPPAATSTPGPVNPTPAAPVDKPRPQKSEDKPMEKKKRGRKKKMVQQTKDASKADAAASSAPEGADVTPQTPAVVTQPQNVSAPSEPSSDKEPEVEVQKTDTIAPKEEGKEPTLSNEERAGILKKLREYGVDMNFMGSYCKRVMGMSNPTHQGSVEKWNALFARLDEVKSKGEYALIRELSGTSGEGSQK